MSRVAIVAALERELRIFLKRLDLREKEYDGRRFRFFELGNLAVVVCGGIGPEAARRATEAVIALYSPRVVWSVGYAGALDPTLKVGALIQPGRVVDAGDGSSVTLPGPDGVLVSFASVANAEQKVKLRESFSAQAVDMEAAAVARAAAAHGVGFAAKKAISDDASFEFPAMGRFIDSQGNFSEARFALFAAIRPWLWPRVLKLAINSKRASRSLGGSLRHYFLEPRGENEQLLSGN